jgi:hypothetical protein
LKTIVVDLSNLLPSGTRLLRLQLGVWAPGRLLLDRVRLDDAEPVDVKRTYVEATSAELVYRGAASTTTSTFSSRIVAVDDETEDNPAFYTYGTFTRYGDVLSLLQATDDKYAIMRYGDQITIKFPGIAPPPAGWARSLMLEADVFYKVIMDPTAIVTVEPLPFHGMLQYPYVAPQAYPSDSEHEDYQRLYNSRVFPNP